jgi:FlaA1/EpsC-like NDP-sugar epimerase
LRRGEKLYEELLIGDAASASPHPKIKLADEAFLPWPALDKNLKYLADCIDLQQTEKTLEIISELVSGFCQDETKTPNSKR